MIRYCVLLAALIPLPTWALHPVPNEDWLRATLKNIATIDDDIRHDEEILQKEDKRLKPNDAKIAILNKNIASLKEKRKWAFQLAMRETIRAYDIAPHDENGRSNYALEMQSPDFEGQKKLWIVLYKKPEKRILSGKSDFLEWPEVADNQTPE